MLEDSSWHGHQAGVLLLDLDGFKAELFAEGVESEDQAAFLKANGCHVGQGWLYGKAMPQAQFEANFRIK